MTTVNDISEILKQHGDLNLNALRFTDMEVKHIRF